MPCEFGGDTQGGGLREDRCPPSGKEETPVQQRGPRSEHRAAGQRLQGDEPGVERFHLQSLGCSRRRPSEHSGGRCLQAIGLMALGPCRSLREAPQPARGPRGSSWGSRTPAPRQPPAGEEALVPSSFSKKLQNTFLPFSVNKETAKMEPLSACPSSKGGHRPIHHFYFRALGASPHCRALLSPPTIGPGTSAVYFGFIIKEECEVWGRARVQAPGRSGTARPLEKRSGRKKRTNNKLGNNRSPWLGTRATFLDCFIFLSTRTL